ncbi:hypothetical protein HYPSUDRAFT_207657 [Hypholoma sublateritium FD-334 SS-4]|uniref:Uncharacterized protein n=1 Tax=Hypholoma sublateritium (strain FD-334 SS-4) TaxID=945553 RepID=A0A0D2LXY7_HYPSF|nr:hypothetical protein HYPSUDRAFT_207657 [Hypholoma sublateritium FD-334 SS-4]
MAAPPPPPSYVHPARFAPQVHSPHSLRSRRACTRHWNSEPPPLPSLVLADRLLRSFPQICRPPFPLTIAQRLLHPEGSGVPHNTLPTPSATDNTKPGSAPSSDVFPMPTQPARPSRRLPDARNARCRHNNAKHTPPLPVVDPASVHRFPTSPPTDLLRTGLDDIFVGRFYITGAEVGQSRGARSPMSMGGDGVGCGAGARGNGDGRR